MLVRGGKPFFGTAIGIIMMDTKFPRGRGNLGNATTFPFPVCYKVLQGITAENLADDQELSRQKFIEAARELEAEGVQAITSCVGSAARFQRDVANAINIPFFASIYNFIPVIYSMINANKIIGLFHDRDRHIGDDLFALAGWSSRDIPVVTTFMADDSLFARMIAEDLEVLDESVLAAEVEALTKDFVHFYPQAGAIVLLCGNYDRFSPMIREVSRLPVFGMREYTAFIAASVGAMPYPLS